MTIDVKSYPGIPADKRGWGSGWPHCQYEKWITAPSPVFGKVHKDVVILFGLLINETEDRGYNLKGDGLTGGTSQCWGADCRPIKSLINGVIVLTKIPSNHSWGLAVDLNSSDNQYGGATHTIPDWMVTLWNKYGFRWGGDYPHTKDWMHFEFMGTPKQAAEMTALAQADFNKEDDVALTNEESTGLAFMYGFGLGYKNDPEPKDVKTSDGGNHTAMAKQGYTAGKKQRTRDDAQK